MRNINTIAIILARGNSKGLKNKNLIKINNKPLLYWTIKHLLASKIVSSIWLSSDSKKILNYGKKFKINTIKRPKLLSNDSASSESGWLHAIKYIENKGIKFSYCFCPQVTSPIRGTHDVDNSIKFFIQNNYDSVFSCNIIKDINIWEKKNKKLSANYNYKKRLRRQKVSDKFLENGSFYIFKKDKFLDEKCRFFGKIGYFKMKKIQQFEIDDKDDLNIINALSKYF